MVGITIIIIALYVHPELGSRARISVRHARRSELLICSDHATFLFRRPIVWEHRAATCHCLLAKPAGHAHLLQYRIHGNRKLCLINNHHWYITGESFSLNQPKHALQSVRSQSLRYILKAYSLQNLVI